MKRVFAFALLAGIVAVPGSAALAQAGPAGAAGPAATSPAANPGLNQNILGDQAPQQNIVQDGQPRGELGGLASGAPGVANVQPSGAAPGAAGVAPGAAAPAIAGQAVVGQAVTGQTTAVATQSTVVATQTAAVAQPALNIHEQHFLVARVMHHCMTRTLHDRFLAGQPPVARMGFHGFPFMAPIGDLELQGVGMIADAGGDKGPLYRVTFRNNSRFVARNFQISLVAMIGKLSFDSPVVTVEVPEIAAGAIGTMDIQFPIAVMTMGPKDHLGPFETLVAAIDSFNELPETNEINNVTTLTRANIAVVETTVTTTETAAATTTVTAPAAGVAVAPAAPSAVAPAAPAPVAPVAPVAPMEGVAPQTEAAPAPAPMEKTDLDNIPLDNVEGTSALFTK